MRNNVRLAKYEFRRLFVNISDEIIQIDSGITLAFHRILYLSLVSVVNGKVVFITTIMDHLYRVIVGRKHVFGDQHKKCLSSNSFFVCCSLEGNGEGHGLRKYVVKQKISLHVSINIVTVL